MTEALTLLGLYGFAFAFIICALALGGSADLRSENELQRLVASKREGEGSVHNGSIGDQNG